MGCVSSKQAVSVTPAFDHSGALRDGISNNGNSGRSRVGSEVSEKRNGGGSGRRKGKVGSGSELVGSELGESGRASSNVNVNCNGNGNGESLSFRLGNLQKYVEGEQVAAGWPAWLSAVAGEAIHGWVPLRADSYEKLEKVFFFFVIVIIIIIN